MVIRIAERDYRGAADAILMILGDKEKARRFGERGRDIALSRNWEWYMDQQMKIYDEILGAR